MTETATIPEAIDPERNDWLAQVATPLEGSPCGDDPRDSDEFFLLRQEIEKRQQNQYNKIQTLCREILSESAKDLRVAGYLIMAAVYVRGLVGLAEAVRAYRLIVERFWNDCHPRKPNARRLTVEWLNTPKLIGLIRSHAVDGDPALVTSIADDAAAINACLASHFDDEPPSWIALNEWLAERDRHRKTTGTEPEATTATPAPALSAMEAIGSDRAMLAATQKIRTYLTDRGEPLQATAYARALRWSRLRLPNRSADGCTPIAPPRASALADIQAASADGRWVEVMALCEDVFMEPGGQFLLDLQRWAAEAADADSRPDLSAFITGQTVLLVQRLPDLPRQRFEGGMPFADSATRRWLQSNGRARSDIDVAVSEDEATSALSLAEDAASRAVASQGLSHGLAILKQLPVTAGRPAIAKTLAVSRLCMDAHRPELAVPILEELADSADKTHLTLWEPDLAVTIWHNLFDALQASADNDGRSDTDRSERMAELINRICRTDPEAASQLF